MIISTAKRLILLGTAFGLVSAVPKVRPTPAVGDCRQTLLAACQLLNPVATNRSVAHLQFASRTVFRTLGEKKPREVTTTATLYAQGNRFYFETPQVILWQDGQFITAVMHSQRTVYLTRVPPHATAQGPGPQFAMLRDSMIQQARVVQCGSSKKGGKAYQHIILKPARRDQARYHLTALDFLLDNQGRIRELTVHYPDNSQVVQVTYTIEKQELIRSAANLPTSARTMVLDKNNQLLPAYRGYRIADQTMLTRLPY